MSYLSQRLQLKVAAKQTLTPSVIQMVKLLQLARPELREYIANELAENPVLEESTGAAEELTPAEIQAALETERDPHPADESILEAVREAMKPGRSDAPVQRGAADAAGDKPPAEGSDPFNEIDFGSYFEEYLDPGFRAPASEPVEKPSFETFLQAPVTLADYLQQQLSLVVMSEQVREAALTIIGNLDANGYLTSPLEELAASGELKLEDLEEALQIVQSQDPAGVGARDLRECLMLQLESRYEDDTLAYDIVSDHLKLLEHNRRKELAAVLNTTVEEVEKAIAHIQHLDPWPGSKYSSPAARPVEPEVFIFKEGEEYIVQLNDEDLPQLRINLDYRHMVNRSQESSKEVRNYVKDRYASAIQLIKNIEQRRQTIRRVCEAIVGRQRDFLDNGLDHLRPMMIKDVAEEIGVHPSTVSRAVAGKYAHTPQGVFELRFFFSEAVQGPSGAATPLLILKRRVKKMIMDEDPRKPLTDDQITKMLRAEGIQVTRRTVAKYREDMKIPSTHHRRVRD